MPQLQTQVPHPLAHDTPCLLTARGVTTPTIRVDLLIFVRKRRFKGAAMQIQFDDIGSGECLLWQIREEQLVDNPCPRNANRTLLVAGWMGRYHHAAWHALGANRHVWTIIEAAHHLAFRALLGLIRRQVQTRLDERMIENGVLFATRHEGEASQIGEDCPSAILTIEPEQRICCWELVRCEIATNGRKPLTQFHSVATVAAIAKRAEPVETVGLANDGAGAHHLPPLAPCVARSTEVIQPAKGQG